MEAGLLPVILNFLTLVMPSFWGKDNSSVFGLLGIKKGRKLFCLFEFSLE